MAQALEIVALFPQCIQVPASKGITLSGCGSNISCLCTNNYFLALLQNAIEETCSPEDGQKTLELAKEFCIAAVPTLNDSKLPLIIVITIILMVLSIIAVILRFAARKVSKVYYGWDDYLIILALVLAIGENVVILESGISNGLGKHVITLTTIQITNFSKTYFAGQFIFGASVTTAKLSILCFYHRIFPSRRFTIITIVTGCIQIAWWISLFFSILFSCSPIQFFWDKTIHGGHCLDDNTLAYGITGAEVITDLIILLLPIPLLVNLHQPLSRKLTLIGIFILGGFTCFTAVIRLPLLVKLNAVDITWTIVDSGIWLQVEANLGVVCACLPILGPLVRMVLPALRSQFSKASNSTINNKAFMKFDGKDNSSLSGPTWIRTASSAGGPDVEAQAVRKPHLGWYSTASTRLTREEQDDDSTNNVEMLSVSSLR